MFLDFLMEFRFEYVWPCWLFIRTVHDSFKYQGLVSPFFDILLLIISSIASGLRNPSFIARIFAVVFFAKEFHSFASSIYRNVG